jgi:hypothetical protein
VKVVMQYRGELSATKQSLVAKRSTRLVTPSPTCRRAADAGQPHRLIDQRPACDIVLGWISDLQLLGPFDEL